MPNSTKARLIARSKVLNLAYLQLNKYAKARKHTKFYDLSMRFTEREKRTRIFTFYFFIITLIEYNVYKVLNKKCICESKISFSTLKAQN